MEESTVTVVISVNGKVRDKIEVAKDSTEAILKEKAMASEKVQSFTEGKTIVKWIFVPNKLINVVI